MTEAMAAGEPGVLTARTARTWVGVALVAAVAQFVLGLGFLLGHGVLAPVSDLAVAVAAVTLVPVAVYLYGVQRRAAPVLGLVAFAAAVAGLSVAAVAALALVALEAGGPQLLGVPWLPLQLVGLALQGVWMGVVGVVGLRQGRFHRRTSAGALVGGVGYLVGSTGHLVGGLESPLVYLGFVAALAGFLAWALNLRRDLGGATTTSGSTRL